MPIHFSPSAIPGVNIFIYVNGKMVEPQCGYLLGVLPAGTKIAITIDVLGSAEHQCYTIVSHNSQTVRTAKACSEPGVYVKHLTVTAYQSDDGTRSTRIAGWPNNMFCLDLNGKTWNIGIVNQNGRYFLVIEEYIPSIEVNELIPIGMVLSSSPLRCWATINIGSTLFNARLHWTNMPFRRDLGLRILNQGEVIKYEKEDVVELDSASSFRYEIKACTLA